MILVVVHPFGSYEKGQHITDQSVIAAILASEQAAFVVKKNDPPAA